MEKSNAESPHIFRSAVTLTVNTATCEMFISGFLNREYGGRHGAKRLGKRVGVSDRTIENWSAAKCAPRLAEFVNLCRENRKLLEEFNQLVKAADADISQI